MPRVVLLSLAALFALSLALLSAEPAAADDPVFDRAFGAGPADLCSTACRTGSNGSAAAQLSFPAAVAVSGAEVYVADQNNHRVSVYATDGTFVRAFGKGVNLSGGGADVCSRATGCRAGTAGGLAGQLNNPYAVAVAGGEVFVADATNNRVSVFTTGGVFLRAFGGGVNAGSGSPDVCTAATTCRAGVQGGAPGQLNFPLGVAVSDGEVYVADASNNRISVFAADGTFARAFGGTGTDAGQLGFPFDVAIAGGEVYVADRNNHRVSVFATDGTFARAFGKAVNPSIGSPDVCTAASTCRAGTQGGASGQLKVPLGVTVAGGEVFVSDGNERINVFATDGTFGRAFGRSVNAGAGNPDLCTTACRAGVAGGAAGQLSGPAGMAVAGGELYVAEGPNFRVSVFGTGGGFARAFGKSVWGASPFVCTTATGCSRGAAGGGAAQLNLPYGLAVAGGEAYVADHSNNRITVFSATGTFARAFGKGVNPGAGNADVCTTATGCQIGTAGGAAGQLTMPAAAAVSGGEVYVADQGNNRISVFTTSGTFVRAFGKGVNPGAGSPDVCTAATTCQSGSLGGGAGQLDSPVAVAVTGNEVYVTDQGNRRISVFTVGGAFVRAFGKDVNPGAGNPDVCTTATTCRFGTQGAGSGQLNSPFGLAISGGMVHVADYANHRISVFGTGGAFARALGKGVNAGAGNPDVCTTTCRAGTQGGGAGQIAFPFGVAVGDGAIYVSERFNARLSVFGADGVFARAFGRGVNAGAGNPDVCTTVTTCRAASPGDAAGQFSEPLGLAIVGTDIFIAERLNHRISLFRVPRTEIAASPGSLTFGARDVDDGPTAVQSSTITNTGTEPVTLSALTLSGDAAHFARLTGDPGDCTTSTALTPGQTCTVRLRFDPTTVGAKGATLNIASNAPPVTVGLGGSGIQTELSRAPASLAFAARDVDDGASAIQSSTITNTGTQTVSLSALTLSGDAAHFARLTGMAGDCAATTTLAAGATCALRFAFDPASTGAKAATLTVASGAGPLTVALSGTGVQTELTPSPTALAFGPRDVDDGPGAVETATITNTGTQTVTMTALTLAGESTQFSRLAGGAGDCTATTVLAPGASCTLRMRFDPTSTGAKAATLTVASNAPAVPIGLSGTGVRTQLTRTPSTLAFGVQGVADGATAIQTSTLTNTGTELVSLSALTLSGDATEFVRVTDEAGDCTPVTQLDPAETCTLRVRFDPVSSGAKAATLTVVSNASSIAVALTGDGVHTALAWAPGALAFGARDVDTGASAIQSSTITNTGTDAIRLSALTLSGDATHFARVTGAPGDCTTATRLDEHQSCTVRLRFDPSSIGAKAAILTVASNAAPVTVGLAGSGIQTELSSDPPALAFGSHDVDEPPAHQTATVANTGTEPVTLAGLELSGDSGHFARHAGRAGDCAAQTRLDAGETCAVRLHFDPTVTAAKSGTLTVSSDAPALIVNLTGTGTTIRSDTDGDGTPDTLDTDDDNDNVPDSQDAFPHDPSEWADTDGDGTGDNADTDDDNDGVPDDVDAFPRDPARSGAPVVPAAEAVVRPWRLERLGKVRVSTRRGGAVVVTTGLTVLCPKGGPPCTGRLTLKLVRRSAKTGKPVPIFLTRRSRPVTIAPGGRRRIAFRLSERGAQLLRRRGTLTAVLRASLRVGDRPAVARRARLRLTAPGRRAT